MRTRGSLAGPVLALALALTLLAGCGGDADTTATDPEPSSTSASSEPTATPSETPGETATPTGEPEPEGPPCAKVWKDGAELPGDYNGCVQGETWVKKDSQFCSFGKALIIYDGRFYATRGGPVNGTENGLRADPDYRSAMASCTA